MFPGNNIVKQNSPQTTVTFLPTPAPHTQSPWHLPAPHQQPTTEPAPSRPSFRTSAHAFTATPPSLSLSLSTALSLLCSIWSWLPLFCSLHLEVHWSRKAKASSSASSTLPVSIWPGIAVVAWTQKQPMRSTALKRKKEGEGNKGLRGNWRDWMSNAKQVSSKSCSLCWH